MFAPATALAADENSFVDFTFSAWLNIEGELPLDVVNRWNALRRFGRLQVVPGFLALTMDVSLIGGVSPNNVRANVEIWDHLVQALVPYLREELQKLDTSQQANVASCGAWSGARRSQGCLTGPGISSCSLPQATVLPRHPDCLQCGRPDGSWRRLAGSMHCPVAGSNHREHRGSLRCRPKLRKPAD